MNANMVLLMSCFFSTTSYGHGMSDLGPHKGSIQMPGAFHTELLQESNGTIKVYLLDIDIKNPSVQKSEVIATYHGDKKTALKCSVEKDYFKCTGLSKMENKGQFIIKSVREGAAGNEVTYQLPLGK